MTDQPIPSTNPNLVDSLLHPQALIIRQLLTRPGRIELSKILIDDEENILQALEASVEVESVYYAGDEVISDELKKKLSPKVKIFEVARRTTKKIFENDKVQEDEALIAIAETFGTSRREILAANPGMADQRPYTETGDVIIVPVSVEMSRSDVEAVNRGLHYDLKSSLQHAEKQLTESRIATVDLGNQEFLSKAATDLDPAAAPVVKALDHILGYAFEQRASDIHFEPKRNLTLVRLRIDGVLHDVHVIPKIVYEAVVSRIKLLSGANLAEKRRPWSARCS